MNPMNQIAPWPQALEDLVAAVRYKGGWDFRLEDRDRGQGSQGLTLVIKIITPDSYHPEVMRGVAHFFPVPPAAYDRRSWQRWLFDQILLVETHEAMEFFQVTEEGNFMSEGQPYKSRTVRPYAPSHGPGNSPYMIREIGTKQDTKTQYTGVVKP